MAFEAYSFSTMYGVIRQKFLKPTSKWLWEKVLVRFKWPLFISLLVLLLASLVVIWAVFLIPRTTSEETTPAVKLFTIILPALPIVALLLLAIQALFGRNRKDKEGRAKRARDEKSTIARLREVFDEYRNHPALYMVYVILGWFFLMAVLYAFSPEKLPLGKWIWQTQQKLFWWTPFIFLLGVAFALMKSRVIKWLGVLIWTPLALMWLSALANFEHLYLPEIKDFFGIAQAAETTPVQANPTPREQTREQTFELSPSADAWSEVAIPFGCRLKYQVNSCTMVRASFVDGRVLEFTRCPNDAPRALGDSVKKLEFKSFPPPVTLACKVRVAIYR